MKKSIFVLYSVVALAATTLFAQDPCTQTNQLNANAQGAQTWTGTRSAVTVTGTGDDARGVEIWTEAGNNNNLKVTWYGNNQGGGSAFRAEWTNSTDYLGRFGYFWGTGGKKWNQLGDLCVDYSYKTSGPETGGGYSYIGIYGWTLGSGNNVAEFYIVEDWYGKGQQMPGNLGGNCAEHGNIDVDGRTYKVVTCIRPPGSGCVGCNGQAFGQVFSIRQGMNPSTGNKCGTISISKHFEEWIKMTTLRGRNNDQSPAKYIYDKTYEAKFLAEAEGGTGFFDASYMKFSRTGACYDGSSTPGSSSSSATITVSSSSSIPRSSSSTGTTPSSSSTVVDNVANPTCTDYDPDFCGGAEFAEVTAGTANTIPSTGECVYIGNFDQIEGNLAGQGANIKINGTDFPCEGPESNAAWEACKVNATKGNKPALKDGGYYVFVERGEINTYSDTYTPSNGWGNVVAKPKPKCGDVSPIRLPQIAVENIVSQMNGGIYLQTENNAVVDIFSLSGKKMSRQTFTNGTYSISLGHLPKGMYVVKVSFGSQRKTLTVPVL